jgi:hypothetical protein
VFHHHSGAVRRRGTHSYHGAIFLSTLSFMFSPTWAETGMNVRSVLGLNPSALRKGVILDEISSNLNVISVGSPESDVTL